MTSLRHLYGYGFSDDELNDRIVDMNLPVRPNAYDEAAAQCARDGHKTVVWWKMKSDWTLALDSLCQRCGRTLLNGEMTR